MTKLLIEQSTKRVLGCGIVGVDAATSSPRRCRCSCSKWTSVEDIAVHPHVALAETFALSAELAYGSIADLMPPRQRSRA